MGEGSDSLLYTTGNKIVWAIMPVVGATIMNFYRVVEAKRNGDKIKIKTYLLIQAIVFTAYTIFTLKNILHNGYRI